MARIDHAKRNKQAKVSRQSSERSKYFKAKKATKKQLDLLKKLGYQADKNMTRKNASDKISEALKLKRA